VEGIFLSFLH